MGLKKTLLLFPNLRELGTLHKIQTISSLGVFTKNISWNKKRHRGELNRNNNIQLLDCALSVQYFVQTGMKIFSSFQNWFLAQCNFVHIQLILELEDIYYSAGPNLLSRGSSSRSPVVVTSCEIFRWTFVYSVELCMYFRISKPGNLFWKRKTKTYISCLLVSSPTRSS